jgi:hypothetical protein
MASLELCTDHMSSFMGPDKPSSFCNYYVEPHLPASCGAFTFWRKNRAEGQDFIQRAGAQFRHSRDLRMIVVRESVRESNVWRVGQVLPLRGVYRFESPWDSQLWVAAYHCSHLVVCLVYCLWIRGVGYRYVQDYNIFILFVIAYLWRWHESTFCLFILVVVCRCKHGTWVKKLKWLN